MGQRSAWVLLGVVGWMGCVPLPVALPPAKVGVAVMGAQKAEPADDFVLAGMVEAGVFPWQLKEMSVARLADLGLGYRGTFGDVGPSLMGPYVEAGLLVSPAGDWWRLGTHVQLQALSQSGPLHIGGAAINLRQSIEIFTFVSEGGGSCDGAQGCFLGVSRGESGSALYVEAGAGALDGRAVWHISAGLTLRIPASFGVALVPIF